MEIIHSFDSESFRFTDRVPTPVQHWYRAVGHIVHGKQLSPPRPTSFPQGHGGCPYVSRTGTE